ncbi:MAG: metal-dependent transcriptional regulator [Firmicutes bacterium]|nr:metal-dependent transcriptional regulator [Bacillota bacterium]
MKIQESGENYLETILILEMEKGNVRSIDVANHLEFSKASISRAMGILKEAGYITVDEAGNLLLTDAGREKANQIYERHQLIQRFLVECLEVSEETAEKDACRMEHVLSEETVDQMRTWIEAAEEFEQMSQQVSTANLDLQKQLEEMAGLDGLEALFGGKQ